MFGSVKPAPSTGIFGQNQNNTQQSSNLFGSNNTGSGSLFGNQNGPSSTNQQPAPLGQTNSMFGKPLQNQNQNQNQSTLGSIGGNLGTGFGSNQTSAPSGTTSTSIFGNKPTLGSTGLTSTQSSTFQKPETQPSAQQTQPVITPFTRPSDLPEGFQKELQDMDTYIRQQEQLSEDLMHAMSEHKQLVTSTPRDVQLLRFKLTSAKETLKFDDGQLARLKQLIDTDYHDSELLAEVTNQPRKYDRLLPYFRRVASCDATLDQLSLAMRDIQQALTAEEFGNRVTYDEQGLRALPNAMREEYMYFMSLSDRIAELHRHIQDDAEGETLEDMQIS